VLSLRQVARLRTDDGARLPHVWSAWTQAKIFLRRGQLHLMVAAPGGFKSTVATNYAIWSGAATLYISMDTDRNTVATRVIACATHTELDVAEEGYAAREPWAMAALGSVPWLTYSFPSGPSARELGEHVSAYAEAEGQYPELVVVDNLGNIAGVGMDHEEADRVMGELQTMASKTNAAVWVLHHALGGFDDGHEVIPLSGVKNKVTKTSSLVLTLARGAGEGQLWTSVVKNRHGPVDPTGRNVRAELRVFGSKNLVLDPHVLEVAG